MFQLRLHDLFYGMFLLLIPVTIAYLFLLVKLTDRLYEEHPERYKELGEFDLVSNNTPSNGIKLCGFLLRGAYKALNDSRLNLIAGSCRSLLIVGILLSAGCMVILTFYETAVNGG